MGRWKELVLAIGWGGFMILLVLNGGLATITLVAIILITGGVAFWLGCGFGRGRPRSLDQLPAGQYCVEWRDYDIRISEEQELLLLSTAGENGQIEFVMTDVWQIPSEARIFSVAPGGKLRVVETVADK